MLQVVHVDRWLWLDPLTLQYAMPFAYLRSVSHMQFASHGVGDDVSQLYLGVFDAATESSKTRLPS